MKNQFKVKIDNVQESVKVPKGIRMLVRRCCKAVLHEENREDFENVNIVFAENQMLNELGGQNLEQEHKELFVRQPRDNESESREHLGEVFISLESAMQRSEAFNNSFESEVAYLTAHGVFLLLGYRNGSVFERDVLRDKESRIIHNLGMTYQVHA